MVMMKYTDDCGGGGGDEEKGWRSLLARPTIGGTTTNAAQLPASHATSFNLVWKHRKIQIIHAFLILCHYSAKTCLW